MLIKNGWGGRIRTHEWRDQNPLPYHLATPQKLEHYKNTIFSVILSLGLVIFLYSSSFLQLSAMSIESKCSGKLFQSDVESILVDKSQIILSQANTVFIDCKPLSFADNQLETDTFRFNRIKNYAGDTFLANSQGLIKNQTYIFEKFGVINFELIDETLFFSY